MLKFGLIALVYAGCSACTSWPVVSETQHSVCDIAREGRSLTDRELRISGIYVTDQLHSIFTDKRCRTSGLSVRMGDIPTNRRLLLENYLRSKGAYDGGFVEIDLVFIGRVQGAGEFGGREIVVSDFQVPAPTD